MCRRSVARCCRQLYVITRQYRYGDLSTTSKVKQEAQLLLTTRPTLVHADVDTKRYEAQLSMLCCQVLPSGEWLWFIGRIFRLLPTPIPLDAHNEGDSVELSGSWLGYKLAEGRMMIDSVVWAQYISVTDTQRRRHSKCRANEGRLAVKWSR